jgi:RNA polymerase sigma factor (sigma-70 family)
MSDQESVPIFVNSYKEIVLNNIFASAHVNDNSDERDLVNNAQLGNRSAMEKLLVKHQSWVYNVALRMTCNPKDSQDITQDILLKVSKKLSGFEQKSSFRTWLYRITVRTILDYRKSNRENIFTSFEQHANLLSNMADNEPANCQDANNSSNILIEETRTGCMMGMLLCLDRMQRIVFILGGILNINSITGSEIFQISPANFCQQLSRARKDLKNYMSGKCNLISSGNPCSCIRKTKAAIAAGFVDPGHLKFHYAHFQKVNAIVTARLKNVSIEKVTEMTVDDLFRDQPFWECDFLTILKNIKEIVKNDS